MAQTFVNNSGMVLKFYTKAEQDESWKEIEKDISHWPAYVLSYDRTRELEYFTLSDKEIAFERFEKTIKSNGQTRTFKCTLINESDKTWQIVNEMNGYKKPKKKS